MPIEDNTSLERPANSRAWDILRVGAIVVPWLCAVIPPVILLTGFYASVGRLLFFCPPALALAFVRWWRSRAFWLVWAGYLAFVAESALLATLLVFLLSPLNNLLGGARL